jgi:hypothetical protein
MFLAWKLLRCPVFSMQLREWFGSVQYPVNAFRKLLRRERLSEKMKASLVQPVKAANFRSCLAGNKKDSQVWLAVPQLEGKITGIPIR